MSRGRSADTRCPTGKRKYYDRLGALLALAESSASASAQRNEVRAYRCPRCNCWHLTSKALYERPVLAQYRKDRKLPYAKPELGPKGIFKHKERAD